MPRNGLSGFIRKYQVFDFTFPRDQTLPLKFYVPVPEHCITFYIKDLQRFSHVDARKITTYPRCVINGMYHTPINRYGGYDFLAIKAVLEPGALFRLTGLSPFELTNTFIDGEVVWVRTSRVLLNNSCWTKVWQPNFQG